MNTCDTGVRDISIIAVLATLLFTLLTANLVVFLVWITIRKKSKRETETLTLMEDPHDIPASNTDSGETISDRQPLSPPAESVSGICTSTNEAYVASGIPLADNPAESASGIFSDRQPLSPPAESASGICTSTNEAYVASGIPLADNPAYQPLERDSTCEGQSPSQSYSYAYESIRHGF